MVGLSGEGQNFDGNGMYVRFQTGGGSQHRLARHAATPGAAAVRQRCRRRRWARPAYPGSAAVQAASPATSSSCPTSTARPPRSRSPTATRRRHRSQHHAAPRSSRTLRTKLRPFGAKPEAARVKPRSASTSRLPGAHRPVLIALARPA